MTLDGLRNQLRQRARITARLSAAEWQRTLRATSPIDTGRMADQTTVRDFPDGSGVTIEAKVDTGYAEYVRSGTRPHRIAAVNADALRFTWQGGTVFFKSVNHPGTQPNDWFDRAAARMPGVIRRNWAQANV